MPLAVIVSFIVKTILLMKIPSIDIVLNWPLKSVEFSGDEYKYNAMVISLCAIPGYHQRMRTSRSVYITESYMQWKRPGLCYYIIYDEPGKMINIYFKNLAFYDKHVSGAMNAIMSHFQAREM
jgi:hypothetical protein